MISLIEVKNDKRFPSFISSHKIFDGAEQIKKVFPHIGLENFEEDADIDNSTEIIAAGVELVALIYSTVNHRSSTLTRYAEITKKPFGDKRKVKHRKCQAVLTNFKESLSKSLKAHVVKNPKTKKITLNVVDNINDETGATFLKKGESLFKAYGKINELLRDGLFLAMPELTTAPQFKKFNGLNLPSTSSKIVFSSDGMVGAWDIATMSMRGIQSCQTWGQSNASHLVGSIVDPCTAIMYLTSGTEIPNKGRKMVRRSIVRFIVDKTDNKPTLIIERMYPSYNVEVAKSFVSILTKKVGGKIRVRDIANNFRLNGATAFVPATKTTSKLDAYSLPYLDCALPYSKLQPGADSAGVEIKAKLLKIKTLSADNVSRKLSTIRLKDCVSQAAKNDWRKKIVNYYSVWVVLNTCLSVKTTTELDKLMKNIVSDSVKDKQAAFNECVSAIFNDEMATVGTAQVFSILDKSHGAFSEEYKLKVLDAIKASFKEAVDKAKPLPEGILTGSVKYDDFLLEVLEKVN